MENGHEVLNLECHCTLGSLTQLQDNLKLVIFSGSTGGEMEYGRYY
jgi:hypothetical protein